MAAETFNPGDVVIHQAYVGSLDNSKFMFIKDQLLRIDIYESILSPVMFGSLTLNDNINIRDKLPIMGNECKLVFEISVPGPISKPRKFEFLITDIQNVAMGHDAASSRYDLQFYSIEVKNNANRLRRTPLNGMSIDGYVKMILENDLQSSKPFYCENQGTKGIQDLNFIGIKPFQAIDMLKQKAVSKIHRSSVYAFYEGRIADKNGFNFLPIELLLSSKNRLLPDAMFFWDSDSATSVKNTTYRNILAYNHITQESPVQLVGGGALNNEVRSTDIKTRGKTVVNFNSATDNDSFGKTKGAKPLYTSAFESSNNKSPTQIYNIMKSSASSDTFLEQKIGYAKAFITLLTQNILRIMVYGDTYLSCGFRVRAEVPSPTGMTKPGGKQKGENSEFVSGEYLVSHARHTISKTDLDFRYFTSLELINASYGKSGGFDT
jgi:hypothetical protein